MEHQRKVRNLIFVFLLTIANIPPTSSNQNVYPFTVAIDIGDIGDDQRVNYAWLQPLNNATTSNYEETTTPLPFSTTIRTKETLDSAETIVHNRYAEPSYHHEEYTGEDNEEVSNDAIPYSEHEEGREVPTKPKYVAPGVWAKPPPDKDIPLDFVPTKLHAQVRGTHTVKRLPRKEAIKSAETDEEKHNAHRLREVVTNSKVNTVYTEEGYEDSAYDHAGHVRDADFHQGYARKLHDRKDDRRDSSSGKKTGVKHQNPVPDEFKDYGEDYQDHLEESRKHEKTPDDEYNLIGYGRNDWEGSELDPKLVAENGIQKLQEDIEEDADETERNSKIYQNAQESRLRNETETDSLESEEARDEDDLEDEENKPAPKKKSSKSPNENNYDRDKERKKINKSEDKKKIYRENYETTIVPSVIKTDTDVNASPHGFVTNPWSSQTYSVDHTTLQYVVPSTTTSFQQVDDQPTTSSYGQLFWDYFKLKQGLTTTEPAMLASNSTTLNTHPNEPSPIAVATIDGRGPYLLVTQEETTTLPSTFFGSHSFRPQNLIISDNEEFSTNFAREHNHRLPGQSNVNYESFDNVIATSTAATFTSPQPLLEQPSQSPKPEETEYSSSATPFDNTTFNSTPAVTLNITKEAYSRIDDHRANPFLSPIIDNSNIAIIQDKLKYKVLMRPKPKKSAKPVKENQKIRDEQNAKYTKMEYLRNKQKSQSPENKKIIFPDLTLLRPPTLERIVYPFFTTNRPAIYGQSSVSVENDSPREANWRNPSQGQHRIQPADPPFHLDSIAIVHPVRLIHRKNQPPATKLLPPLPIANPYYANYRSKGQKNDHLSQGDGKSRQRDNAFRYFPLNLETSWRTRSRRKRSEYGEFRDGDGDSAFDVKAAANNSVTKYDESAQRDKRVYSGTTGTAESRDGESATSIALANENSTIIDRESENAEARHGDAAKKTAIDGTKSVDKEWVLLNSTRQKRQINDENAEDLVKGKRNVSRRKRLQVSRGNIKYRANRTDHEELLDESPKISGDVIDEEIAARFNEKGTNETSAKIKNREKVEAEVPSFDSTEELAKDSPPEPFTTTESDIIDTKKYPFYNNENVPSASALKYVVNPRTIPRKTSRGMEFYNSRNAYKQCDEVEPNLDKVVPEKEEPDPDRGPQGDLPRLRGLGERLDCFKAKYFDENPFDSPLFAEKSIKDPSPPPEIDPIKFVSKVLVLPEEDDEHVVHQVSKKPERNGRQWRNKIPQYETHESIRVNYKHDPQTGRGRNAYMHTVRGLRPPVAVRTMKNRRTRMRISNINKTTPVPPKLYQTASYQNQVYEDVMGNIRNMAKSMTTLPPATQVLATASSENALKVSDATLNSPRKKEIVSSGVSSDTKSSEIKGLLPPPIHSIARLTPYRKYRPASKNRMTLLRSPDLSRIIAHHHRTIKLNKRSATENTTKNFSISTTDENDKNTINKSIEFDSARNNTIGKSIEEITKSDINSTSEILDFETEESKQVRAQDQSFSLATQKFDDKKRRRNFESSDPQNESSPKIVYTIRDRIRYSKPKWNTEGFGKFNTSPKTVDEDSRRKEPRYNHFRKRKPVRDQSNNFTILQNSTDSISDIENASPTKSTENNTTETYRLEESILQSIYDKENEHIVPEKADSIIDAEFKENDEEETERTTKMYSVHEHVDEDVPATTTAKLTGPFSSKEILSLQKYLESDPPGYAEAFPEEATTPSSEYHANVNDEIEDDDEKQDEETDYPKNVADPLEDDSSEKNAEEQVETPIKTELTEQDDSSEELTSKEEEGSKDDQTFTTPSWVEDDEKARFYRPYPFSRYKSTKKEESDEEVSEEDSEEEEEQNEDYVFPWRADRENDKSKWLANFDRYEYPWEKRERLVKERERKRKRANKFKELISEDEDEEESGRPVYSWEKYAPFRDHTNARRDVSSRNIDDDEESNTEQLPLMKFSSRYSTGNTPTKKSSSAQEISRSIKKFLEENVDDEEEASKESEDRSSSLAHQKSSSASDRGISRGTLVPEDITLPPRRKNGRGTREKIKSNSQFDFRKLKSKEIDDDDDEGENATVKYLKSSDSNSDSESQIDTANGQLSDITKKTSPIIAQRKKRRRRILKNNSTTSPDNISADSTTEPIKRKRRKPQRSTTTSTTPSASIDLETSKSIFAPIRKKYSDRSNSGGKFSTSATKISRADNVEAETSTPKTRTVEHRSRVSKEKIITKTTYPDEVEIDSTKENGTSSVRKEPLKRLKIKLNRRRNNNRRNDENYNAKEKVTKRKGGNYDAKLINEDENERSMMSEKSKVTNKDNPLNNLGIKKEDVAKINNFSNLGGIINDEEDDGSAMTSEAYIISNLLRNAPPSRRNDRAKKRTRNKPSRINKGSKEQINSKENKDAEEKRRLLLQTKFIKDPERRLYYYVERK